MLRGEGLCLSFTVPLCFLSLCSFITLSQLGLGLSLLGKLPSDRWQKQPRAPCPQLLPLCSVPGDRTATSVAARGAGSALLRLTVLHQGPPEHFQLPCGCTWHRGAAEAGIGACLARWRAEPRVQSGIFLQELTELRGGGGGRSAPSWDQEQGWGPRVPLSNSGPRASTCPWQQGQSVP